MEASSYSQFHDSECQLPSLTSCQSSWTPIDDAQSTAPFVTAYRLNMPGNEVEPLHVHLHESVVKPLAEASPTAVSARIAPAQGANRALYASLRMRNLLVATDAKELIRSRLPIFTQDLLVSNQCDNWPSALVGVAPNPRSEDIL